MQTLGSILGWATVSSEGGKTTVWSKCVAHGRDRVTEVSVRRRGRGSVSELVPLRSRAWSRRRLKPIAGRAKVRLHVLQVVEKKLLILHADARRHLRLRNWGKSALLSELRSRRVRKSELRRSVLVAKFSQLASLAQPASIADLSLQGLEGHVS